MRSARVAPRLVAAAAVAWLTSSPAPVRADDASCIGASESALTLRKKGQLRDALKQLAVCADTGCPGAVRSECTRRIDELRTAIPTLILLVKDSAGNDVIGAKVTVDGAAMTDALDGRPLALDPGEHTLTFERPGLPTVEKKLVLHESEKDRHETIVLPSALPAPGVVVVAPPPLPATPSAPPVRESSWSTSKTLALALAGLGVASAGVGAGFGVAAISSQNKEKSDCPQAGCANHAQAVSDYNSAHQDGTASSIALVVGASLVAAGALLWLTAPSHTEAPSGARLLRLRIVPLLSERTGGLSLGGDL